MDSDIIQVTRLFLRPYDSVTEKCLTIKKGDSNGNIINGVWCKGIGAKKCTDILLDQIVSLIRFRGGINLSRWSRSRAHLSGMAAVYIQRNTRIHRCGQAAKFGGG